jgi:hypothetical protein
MNELEIQEARLLARARRGLSPSEADRTRVRLGIASALASRTVPDEEAPSLEPTRGAALLKAAFGVGIVALAGMAGYATGHRVGFATGAREAAAKAPPEASHAVSVREVTLAPEAASPLVPPASGASAESPRFPNPREKVAVPVVPPSDETGVDGELRILRRVERAQRASNPRLALALLDELDRDQPRGRLMEERAAARAVAECQSTFGSPRSETVKQFRKRYASSVYLTRVEVACEETERTKAGDSSVERESPR